MNKESAVQALDDIESLINRALKIVSGPPYWAFCSEEEFALLRFLDTGQVELVWPEVWMEWDSPSLEPRSVTFPAEFLFMPEEEIDAWKAEQRRLYDATEKRRQHLAMLEADRQERQQYEQLKQKYG